MALSTTQYGYIIDPMVPFTDGKGKTIKDGFVRVFVAGSSTPVITYRNFDGAENQDLIELDNSGRTKTSVIGSKGLTYKVCVYDKDHSQESPILTVDKVSVIGANITAGAGATVVTGLDGLTTKPDGFVDASVVGTDGYVALDHTLVTDDLNTDAKVDAVENDRYITLLNNDVNDPDSKMTLGRLWQWVLGKIKSLPTTITAFRTGDVIPVDGPSGTAKMPKDDLLQVTAENAIGGNLAPAFDQNKSDTGDGYSYHVNDLVTKDGKWYVFKVNHTAGASWSNYEVDQIDGTMLIRMWKNISGTQSFSSVDDLPKGLCALVSTSLTNRPNGKSGVCFTLGSHNASDACQVYITTQNVLYYRFKHSGTFTAWTQGATESEIENKFNTINNITNTDTYDDVDTLPPSSACTISAGLANRPDNKGGTCITFGSTNTSGSYSSQFYCTSQGLLYFRTIVSRTWTSWSRVAFLSDIDAVASRIDLIETAIDLQKATQSIEVKSSSNYINAVGNVHNNASFSYTKPITLPANKGVSIVCGGYNTNVSIISEVVTEDSDYSPLVVCTDSDIHTYTYKNTSGADKRIAFSFSNSRSASSVTLFNFVEAGGSTSQILPSFGIFDDIGVVGDSYASGVIYIGDSSQGNNYPISWPQIMARELGATCFNYSWGGADTLDFLTKNDRGLPKLLSDAPKKVYILALQINDQRGVDGKTGAEWLGTTADINLLDPTQNARSYCGCYGKIISAIKSHAPDAKIIMMKHVTTSALYEAYNDTIDEIASLFGIVTIAQDNDPLFTDALYTAMSGGHPTRVGHSAMASAILRLLNECMTTNRTYFNS